MAELERSRSGGSGSLSTSKTNVHHDFIPELKSAGLRTTQAADIKILVISRVHTPRWIRYKSDAMWCSGQSFGYYSRVPIWQHFVHGNVVLWK